MPKGRIMKNQRTIKRTGFLSVIIMTGLLLAQASQAATYYKGVISDSLLSGKLDSVLVKVKGTSIQTYTNSQGQFTIAPAASAVLFNLSPGTKNTLPGFNPVSRTISWTGSHSVKLTVFNALGAVAAASGRINGAGSFALPRLANGAYFLKTEMDGNTSLGKLVLSGNISASMAPAAQIPRQTSGKTAKITAAKDTLIFTKAHYFIKQQAVSAGDTNLAVKLASFSSKPNLTLISPIGGETYKIGDSLKIRWRANPDSVIGMLFSITFNAGQKYWYIKDDQQIQSGHGQDTTIAWKIPDSLYDIGNDVMAAVPASSQCKIRMSDYQVRYTVYSPAFFSMTRQ
jgi:hypothetical protein